MTISSPGDREPYLDNPAGRLLAFWYGLGASLDANAASGFGRSASANSDSIRSALGADNMPPGASRRLPITVVGLPDEIRQAVRQQRLEDEPAIVDQACQELSVQMATVSRVFFDAEPTMESPRKLGRLYELHLRRWDRMLHEASSKSLLDQDLLNSLAEEVHALREEVGSSHGLDREHATFIAMHVGSARTSVIQPNVGTRVVEIIEGARLPRIEGLRLYDSARSWFDIEVPPEQRPSLDSLCSIPVCRGVR